MSAPAHSDKEGRTAMKKTIAILLACLMILSLAACGGGSNEPGTTEEPESQAPQTLADDTSIYEMRFTVPEGYASVERYCDLKSDGSVIEKDINYVLADGTKISYGCMKGQHLSDITDVSALETKEIGGLSYYYVDQSGAYCAFAQKEDDLYAVQYTPVDGDGARLDELLAALEYGESVEPIIDDTDLYGINYKLDETLNVCGVSVLVSEDTEGKVTKKYVLRKFGENVEKPDFRFVIYAYPGATVESFMDETKEYETKTVGELEYTVLKNDSGSPYEYYIKNGDTVYEIRNNGASSGWGVTRSDESVAAFEALLNTVSF